MIITIDGGTTNTRITLVDDKKIIDRAKINIGAGLTAKFGSNDRLKGEIAEGIKNILKKNKVEISDVSSVLASGMLTSELGIYTLPHIFAPCGIKELHRGMKTVMLPDICEIPITFIPGVKNESDYNNADSLSNADMMRGEETELIGLLNEFNLNSSVTVVLPGTHTKIIKVIQECRIEYCKTTLGGELLSCIPQNTILKSSASYPLICENPDFDYINMGYICSRDNGISSALFKGRILSNLYGVDSDRCGCFLAGVILQSDIFAIINSAGSDDIIVGGSNPLRDTFKYLLQKNTDNKVYSATDAQVENSTVFGAISIGS